MVVLLEYSQSSKIKLPALHIAAKKDDVSAAKLLLKSEGADKESMVSFTAVYVTVTAVSCEAVSYRSGAECFIKKSQ